MLFGIRRAKWKRIQGIPNDRRSSSTERIDREVIKARGLIVDHEISNHRAYQREEEAHVLSRATERTEREIMDNLEANLSLKDGPFPRLPTMKFRHPNEHIYAFKIFTRTL